MIKQSLLLLLVSASLIFTPPPQKTASFWERLKSFFGVSANPGNQKGPDPEASLDIYLYNVATKIGNPLKQGSFRSPIFTADDKAILALSGNKVVRIQVDNGDLSEIPTDPGIVKLVGAEKDTANILVLTDLDNDNCLGVGVLSLTNGQITKLSYGNGQEDRDMVGHLRSWTREYDNGDMKLDVRGRVDRVNNSDVTTTDAFLLVKGQPEVNVSRCPTGVLCGQPSLSNNRKTVVFISRL
jgi:hypothetical protein